MTHIDLYSDYIGELEIILTEKNQNGEIVFKVDLWYADFTSLMGYIPLHTDMHQDSVAYNWQRGEGFYNMKEWECKRVQEFHDQLTAVGPLSPEAGLNDVKNAILQISLSALQSGNKLFIQYT
ncbi:MAG: hypothetical protein AAGC65_24015 [Mucilaginibacter sp.]|uniref:hypothetical protein n=1 Tax=Mucilaginibacter sp. TaxID=1882438 RepID=UPI0031B560BC